MSSSSPRELLFNACALNNIGTSLMQHGQYDAALMVMKESLTTMKTYFHMFSSSLSSEETDKAIDASRETLRQSYGRVAQASIDKTSKNQFLTQEWRLVESNDFATLRATSLGQESNAAHVAIVIREPCHPQVDEDAEIALAQESAIMLYNYALSSFFVSTTTRRKKYRDSFYSIAREALLLSHKTLYKRMMEFEDIVEDVESVFLSIFVLSCTTSLLRSRQEYSRADEAEDAMYELLDAVEEENVDYLDAVSNNSATTAAAA